MWLQKTLSTLVDLQLWKVNLAHFQVNQENLSLQSIWTASWSFLRASTSKPSWLEQYDWTWRYTDYPPASKSSMLLISRRDNNPLESCETVCCTVHKSSLWKWTGRWVVQRATKTCYWWWLLDLWTKLSGLTQAESEKDTADLRRQPIWEGAQS